MTLVVGYQPHYDLLRFTGIHQINDKIFLLFDMRLVERPDLKLNVIMTSGAWNEDIQIFQPEQLYQVDDEGTGD